jgi:hypothetical protein
MYDAIGKSKMGPSSLLVWVPVMLGVVAALYLAFGDATRRPAGAHAPQREAPASVCLQEECAERPAAYECERATADVCHKYRVVYERACVCTKRGAP